MKNLLASIGIGAIMALSGAGIARAEPPVGDERAQELYLAGEEAARAGRWRDAYESFFQAWSRAPGPYTAGELGRVEVEFGLDDAAQVHIGEALRALPEDATARALLQQSLDRARARATLASRNGPVADPPRASEPPSPPAEPAAPRGADRPSAGPVLAAGGLLGLSSLAAGAVLTVQAGDAEEGAQAFRRAAAFQYALGALILGGTVTYVLWPRAEPSAHAVQVQAAPVVSHTGGGLVVVGAM